MGIQRTQCVFDVFTPFDTVGGNISRSTFLFMPRNDFLKSCVCVENFFRNGFIYSFERFENIFRVPEFGFQ